MGPPIGAANAIKSPSAVNTAVFSLKCYTTAPIPISNMKSVEDWNYTTALAKLASM